MAVLGSTGSVGTSTLDVIRSQPDRFDVVALACRADYNALQQQIDEFRPTIAAVLEAPGHLRDVRELTGPQALLQIALLDDIDILVVATTGHVALGPTIAALQEGRTVALANKETIVAAGAIVMPLARQRPGRLRTLDSEHSAIWQCLDSEGARPAVQQLILTASGGPFRGWSAAALRNVTRADALRHPTWDMGAKITIDSATLMNKGLEVIEAHWLFDQPFDNIDVVIHPQSLVHSMVEYVDGSIMAQLGTHDMRTPIRYALNWPKRLPTTQRRLSLLDVGALTFEAPDRDTFRCLALAEQAGRAGGLYGAVLSAADSVAVDAFLQKRITFTDIPALVARVMDEHTSTTADATSLEAIYAADVWASARATALVEHLVPPLS